MSQETLTWLNQNTLIGFTDKRGEAWHYKASEQGAEPNHYPLAIPVADVERRLFHWEAERWMPQAVKIDEDGVTTITDESRVAIVRPDTGQILAYFKDGYEIHQYNEWLLNNVASILDDDLAISSAGLLVQGGLAWVEVGVPENIVTPEGVEFRPNLLAATSHNGDIKTTYKRTVTATVCDNTLAVALRDSGRNAGQTYGVKHTRNSAVRLVEAREALRIVNTLADDFSAQVAELTAKRVDPVQWDRFVDVFVPTTDAHGDPKTGRGLTMATNRRDVLNRLWNTDPRVAPWQGTAFGVVQAVNTAVAHEFSVHGERAERNMLRTITGEFDKLDTGTLALLEKVIA